MARLKKAIIRAGLEALYFTGAHELLRPLCGGVGAALTLHQVCPPRHDSFQPNHLLEVTPEFLEAVIVQLRRWNIDIISLDELHRRLVEGDFRRRFACFTFDDAYNDHREHVHPIFKRHGAPFAVFVPTSFPDRRGELWWVVLETVIAKTDRLTVLMDGAERRFNCAGAAAKYRTFETLYWWLRTRPSNEDIRAATHDLAARYGVDIAAICADSCMTWDEIAAMAADPLVTIGSHSVNHFILSKLPEPQARAELEASRTILEGRLGKKIEHLAYPFGQAGTVGPREFRIAEELGFKTAVTTRPGVLFAQHRNHLCALPRVSVNGEFQRLRYLRVLVSGAATALWNRFSRIQAT